MRTMEKKKNRVSSVKNIPNKTIQLKKNIIIINKSWNKEDMKLKVGSVKLVNKYNESHSINKNQNKKIDIKKENRSGRNIKISSSKRAQNKFGFENLLNKYINRTKNSDIANFPINKINSNYLKDINIINIEKKVNDEKIKNIPKSDSYKRRLSASFLKKRDKINKNNLFRDYLPKQNEEISINPIINPNPNKNINEPNKVKSNSIFDKILFNKGHSKIKPIKKEDNDPNSYFLKFKDYKELSKQDKLHKNKGCNFINKK